jgi:hypothetical protein
MPKKKQPEPGDLKDALVALLEQKKVTIVVTADDYEASLLHNAGKLASIIVDHKQWLRNQLKHGDPDAKYKKPSDALEAAREAFYAAINEAGVSEDLI